MTQWTALDGWECQGIMPAVNQNEDDDQPKNRVRVILIVALIGVVVAVVASGVWMLSGANERHFATFPGGNTVELLGTTVGSATFTTEKKWQSVARRILPARFQSWIPTGITSGCGSGSNAVTVHLRLANAPRGPGTPTLWQSYAAEDEQGFRYPNNGGWCSSSDAFGQTTYALVLSAYPRRQREFRFAFLDQKGAVIASLRVPNPLRGPFPEWQSSPLPQTKTNGPVRLTLEGWEEIGDGQWHYPRLKFHLQATDPAWAEARERYSTLVDSTGNEGSFLSRREKTWKLKTSVFRERPQDFATNEQVVLTNIAVPSAGSFVAVDQSADCAGVGIKALVLAGAGTFGISNGVMRFMLPTGQGSGSHSTSSWGTNTTESWGSSTPRLMVEARSLQADDEIQFHVIDDTGRELKVESYGYDGMNNGHRMYKPSFVPLDGTRFVSVQIIINRPLRFEFLVNPADVPVGKP